MNNKRKGTAAEWEIVHLLEARGLPAERNEQGYLAGYRSGKGNPDVWTRLAGRDIHCEVKRRERLSIYKAYGQAAADAVNMTPVVLYRANCKPWLAIMSLEDLLTLTLDAG